MSIYDIASRIDIGMVLAEVSGDFKYHGLQVDPEKGTIDVLCTDLKPVKNVAITLTVGRNYDSCVSDDNQ